MAEKELIVVTCPGAISAETADKLRDAFKSVLGEDAPVVVVGEGIHVSVHKINIAE